MHYIAYLDEFGHIGPYVSRTHAVHKTSPVFGLGGLLLPASEVREFAIHFYKLKCRLLAYDLEHSNPGKVPAYRWEKKGSQLYSVRNVERYAELRSMTFRLLQSVRKIDRYCVQEGATFILVLDEQKAGDDWRERNVEACTLAMFNDASEKCRAMIEPPLQGESYLFQTLQCADWICGLIGRLTALSVAPDEFKDWQVFERYFASCITDATLSCSSLDQQKIIDPSIF